MTNSVIAYDASVLTCSIYLKTKLILCGVISKFAMDVQWAVLDSSALILATVFIPHNIHSASGSMWTKRLATGTILHVVEPDIKLNDVV